MDSDELPEFCRLNKVSSVKLRRDAVVPFECYGEKHDGRIRLALAADRRRKGFPGIPDVFKTWFLIGGAGGCSIGTRLVFCGNARSFYWNAKNADPVHTVFQRLALDPTAGQVNQGAPHSGHAELHAVRDVLARRLQNPLGKPLTGIGVGLSNLITEPAKDRSGVAVLCSLLGCPSCSVKTHQSLQGTRPASALQHVALPECCLERFGGVR